MMVELAVVELAVVEVVETAEAVEMVEMVEMIVEVLLALDILLELVVVELVVEIEVDWHKNFAEETIFEIVVEPFEESVFAASVEAVMVVGLEHLDHLDDDDDDVFVLLIQNYFEIELDLGFDVAVVACNVFHYPKKNVLRESFFAKI